MFAKIYLAVFSVIALTQNAFGAPTKVVVSVNYFKDIIEEVTCGASSMGLDVDVVIPAGVDPHTYVLTPNDRRDIELANLYFFVGNGFEPWKINAPQQKKQIWMEVTKNLPLRKFGSSEHHHEDKHHHGDVDTHIWQSPQLTIQAARQIAKQLYEIEPKNANGIKKCLGQFENKIRDAEIKFKALFLTATSKNSNKTIAVNHNAFQYFADAVGFEVVPVLGETTAEHITPKILKDAISSVKKKNVKVIFFESTSPTKDSKTIAKQLGLKFGGLLYADGLGPRGTGAETILGMWTKNLETIVAGIN